MTFKQYWRESRDLSLNVFLILPALVAYEVGVYAMGPAVRNGADLLLRELFQLLGPPGMLILNAVVIASATVCSLDAIERFDFLVSRFAYLALECVAYAAILGPLVLLVRAPLTEIGAALSTTEMGWRSILERVVLALGAGAYEELFFRLLLMTAMFHVFFGILRETKWAAAVAALLTSAAFFALCHHDVILAGGEPFDLQIFLFRTVAGLILGVIFFTRGLAAAVYTHAFYNLLVFFR